MSEKQWAVGDVAWVDSPLFTIRKFAFIVDDVDDKGYINSVNSRVCVNLGPLPAAIEASEARLAKAEEAFDALAVNIHKYSSAFPTMLARIVATEAHCAEWRAAMAQRDAVRGLEGRE